MDTVQVNLNSEVGRLRRVVLHRPGPELEQMNPSTLHEALYSDLLNTKVAQKEYRQLEGVLKEVCPVFYIDDLVVETLRGSAEAKRFILDYLGKNPETEAWTKENLSDEELAHRLVAGVPETRFNPLYNLYFTRDIGVCFNGHSMPAHMATRVRSREILLADLVYRYHPFFTQNASRVNPWEKVEADTRLEGGDFQVCDRNVFVIGQGARSNRKGVQAFISVKQKECPLFYVILQDLPMVPESFIHLDMVFTFLSRSHCMAYKPLIMGQNQYATRLLKVENGHISETVFDTLFDALHSLGYSYEPVFCGNDEGFYPDREQWHSGANFFAFAPGKVMGYGRNTHTIEALSTAGFEVVPAWDVVDGKAKVQVENEDKPVVYTLESSELVRGGGGCRCMTMPVSREDL